MRSDALISPRAPETTPRRLPSAASAAATHAPSTTPSTPQADAFTALLQAADDSLAAPPAAHNGADPAPAPAPPAVVDARAHGDAPPHKPSDFSKLGARASPAPANGPGPGGLSESAATSAAQAGAQAGAKTSTQAARATAQPGTTAPWVSTVSKARAQPTHTAAPKPATELASSPMGWAGLAGLKPQPAAALARNPLAGATGAPASAETTDLADASDATDGLAALSAGARAEAGARGDGSGSGGRGADAAQALLEHPAQSGSLSEAATVGDDFSHLLDQATGQGLDAVWEPLGQQISLWLAGQVKRANLLLHEGLRQSLEIELRLDGKQAQLEFFTDDEQLRESLRSQAQEALSELLGQNGLELVGLSIGSRASGQSDRSAAQRPQASSARSEVTDAAADPPSVVLQPASGRAGLSVYA
ncbi:MAG: hypothetical protein Q7T22_11035 [Serpentinimonas sp.]|nr:hypothetical protein [Serpentinimonas sp.]MDO9612799.1 hypothetical protein [Serpentinimonas sp.]